MQFDIEGDAEIKKADTYKMISKAAKELKTMSYKINRCVQAGLRNFVKLKITNREELMEYHAQLRKQKLLHQGKKSTAPVKPVAKKPWSNIQFCENNPIPAYLDADGKPGTVKFQLRGKVPPDLTVHISENYQHVTEANARWTFEKQSIFSLLPRDQKIENPRKQTDKDAKRF